MTEKAPFIALPDTPLAKVPPGTGTLPGYLYAPVVQYSPLLFVMPDGASSALVVLGRGPETEQLLWKITVSWSSGMLAESRER